VRAPEPLLIPVGCAEGWDRPVRRTEVHVCFDDGSWRPATLRAWLHYPKRGWLMRLRWPDGEEEWRLYDRRYALRCVTSAMALLTAFLQFGCSRIYTPRRLTTFAPLLYPYHLDPLETKVPARTTAKRVV
jgi:hypothetical protein